MTGKREEKGGSVAMETSSSTPPPPPPPLQLSVKNGRPDNDCELVSLVRPDKTPALQAN